MSLQDRLQADLKTAMRNGEKLRVTVIRGARAALQNAKLEVAKQAYDAAAREIETTYANDPTAREEALAAISIKDQVVFDDAAQEAVIAKEIKRRRDAAEIYRQAGQIGRAEEEESEAAILAEYLPRQLTPDELRPQVAAIIANMGLSGTAAMSKLMPVLIARFKGQAEGRILNQIARDLLTNE